MPTPVPKPTPRRGKPDLEAAKAEIDSPFVQWSPMSISRLPLADIDHGANPRQATDPAQDTDLAESVRQHGVLQPIRVRRTEPGRYQIVAGHRRYEAAKTAGLTEIPVTVADVSTDEVAYVQSLVENLQREDLSPIDEAKAFRALLDATKMTQVELGKRVGRSQSQISNSLALLNLKPEVQEDLSAGKITVGHAKVLAYMKPEDQEKLAKETVERKLTVRDVENIAAQKKASAAAEKQRQERDNAESKTITEFLAGQTIDRETVLVFANAEQVKAAVKAGWSNSRVVSWKTDTTFPTFPCDCTACFYQTGNPPSLRKTCINKTHERSAKAKTVAAAKAVEREAENTLDRTRRAAVAGLRAKDAVTIIEDGLRLGLYVVLMREDAYGNGTAERSRQAFVKRHGGEWPQYPSGGEGGLATWEAVEGLSSEDLVEEYLAAIVAFTIPNVYTQSPFANRNHFAPRQWLVDRLGLEASIVWGNQSAWDRGTTKSKVDDKDREDVERLLGVAVSENLGVEVTATIPNVPDEEDQVAEPVLPDPQGPVVGVPELATPGMTMTEALADAGLMKPIAADAVAWKREERLAAAGMVVEAAKEDEVAEAATLPFDGQRICVTGVVEGYDRTEVANLVIKAGGSFVETVNSKTTLLVIGEKPGASKQNAARQFGIRTMSADDFRRIARG